MSTYSPLTVDVTLSNTVESSPGFVKLKTPSVSLVWGYIRQSDVKVDAEFIFTNSSTIEITQAFAIDSLPQVVTISRDTDVDNSESTFAPGTSIRAQDLNNNFTQVLFRLQELGDS